MGQERLTRTCCRKRAASTDKWKTVYPAEGLVAKSQHYWKTFTTLPAKQFLWVIMVMAKESHQPTNPVEISVSNQYLQYPRQNRGCVSLNQQRQFLYLTTVGWKTLKPHTIEIWFVEHNKKYYVVSERKTRSHWVQNVMRNPKVLFAANGKEHDGLARTVDEKEDAGLISDVSDLMVKKYGWGDGLVVELIPCRDLNKGPK